MTVVVEWSVNERGLIFDKHSEQWKIYILQITKGNILQKIKVGIIGTEYKLQRGIFYKFILRNL